MDLIQLERRDRGALSAKQAPRRSLRIALISMPFVSARRPSIQLGLLKAVAERGGYATDTHHLFLDFAKKVGPELYELLCVHRGSLFGDWLFSVAAFGERAPDRGDTFLSRFGGGIEAQLKELGVELGHLSRIRHEIAPAFIREHAELLSISRYDVVGFTSTFQQTNASLALALAMKERQPEIVTIFGGANFEGEMGLEHVRAFDVIDYAVVGEGEEALPELLDALARGLDPTVIPQVVGRKGGVAQAGQKRAPYSRLDELPVPDYDEFFSRAESLGLLERAGRRVVELPFESARGCWWGAKHHCSFCGLNGSSMAFRSKSPARVVEELTEMSRRYRSFHFEAVDNIVDQRYFDDFFPRLTELGASFQFFYETKANLTRDQVRALRQASVRRIQPGIESLSTRVLKLMRKGCTAIQNVSLLRWCRYYGVDVGWNVLWGMPGEEAADYEEQSALIPKLAHLRPPGGAGPIWMERYSPLFFERDTYPAKSIRPEASYEYVFPEGVELNKLAYFFDYELEGTLGRDNAAYAAVGKAVAAWQAAWKAKDPPSLRYWRAPGFLQIDDQRNAESPGTHTFQDALADIYVECSDRPIKADIVAKRRGLAARVDEVREVLDEFCARGLMMRDQDQYLALAIPSGEPR